MEETIQVSSEDSAEQGYQVDLPQNLRQVEGTGFASK